MRMVGMASTARLGLKQRNTEKGAEAMSGVGMASTARLGLKHCCFLKG